MPPRPILKSLPDPDISFTSTNPLPFASSTSILDSPHVHFPPTPTLTSTEITHSPFFYDRAPIVVAPNMCALPERGGRAVFNGDSPCRSSRAKAHKGGYFHPRAYEAMEHEPSLLLHNDTAHDPWAGSRSGDPMYDPHNRRYPPPLVFDHSSESDSSDICGSPPAVSVPTPIPHVTVHVPCSSPFAGPIAPSNPGGYPSPHYHHSPMISHGMYAKQDPLDVSLPFLSYSSSPMKVKRKKRDGEGLGKKRGGGEGDGFHRTKRLLNSSCSSGFYEPDLEGCLGGF